MSLRTITLELLRHGSDHNQLLSPLTQYLALSGNHDAETVHVELEHMQLLRRLSDLRYQGGRPASDGSLREAGAAVSRLLGSIQSLRAELDAIRGARGLVHLRLILSASELALLPFELVSAPPGFPGQGQWLSLQTSTPIVLTREVRRVAPASFEWPKRPRILVAAASPPGVPDVPLRQLLLALRRALAPWITVGSAGEMEEHVELLPNATLDDIYRACAAEAFTHVHILAHGISVPGEDGGARYGLALHAEGDPSARDLVNGESLAAALRCHRDGAAGTIASPVVVTLASCDSGNVGSVITPGASLAHHLHEAGIPLVVASQLPLSFRGAAILAETLYSGLLWGEDPRAIIHQLRQELAIRCPDTHDWASLVAYAAFPADFDRQIDRVKLERRRFAVDTAMARIDLGQHVQSSAPTTTPADGRAEVESATDRALKQAMDRLRAAIPLPEEVERQKLRGETLGRLGSAEKRYAHILVRRASASLEGPRRAALHADIRATLESARAHYLDAFRLDMSAVWALVQRLALDVALGEPLDGAQWITARGLSLFSLAEGDLQNVSAAHGTLAELYVLAQVLPPAHEARADAPERARFHIDALLGVVAPESLDAYSVRHQLARYATWWWKDEPLLRALPDELVKKLDDAGVPSQCDWT
jgi:hypothetical protein